MLSGRAGYLVVFSAATGLIVGSPVKMAGVQIGIGVEHPPAHRSREPGIQVEARRGRRLRRAHARRARGPPCASCSYLSGEKFVEIIARRPRRPRLPEGSVIPSAPAASEILEQGEDIAENLNEITISLEDILEPLSGARACWGR